MSGSSSVDAILDGIRRRQNGSPQPPPDITSTPPDITTATANLTTGMTRTAPAPAPPPDTGPAVNLGLPTRIASLPPIVPQMPPAAPVTTPPDQQGVTPQRQDPLGRIMDPTGRNNPGNIRNPDGAGFQTFPTVQAGIDAVGSLLQTYQNEHGLNTITGILNRYSPPSENNTQQLIADAAKRTGFRPDQPLDMNDPETRQKLVMAIIAGEQGAPGGAPRQQFIPASQWPEYANRSPVEWGHHPSDYDGYGGHEGGRMPSGWGDIATTVLGFAGMAALLSGHGSWAQAAMMQSFQGFTNGLQQGQLAQAKLQREKFDLAVEQHNQQLSEENQQIGDAYASGDVDGLKAIAAKNQDRALDVAIQEGPDAVQRLMQSRDRYNTDLNKTQLALERMRELESTKAFDVVKDGQVVRTIEARERKGQAGMFDTVTGQPIQLGEGETLAPHSTARSTAGTTARNWSWTDPETHETKSGAALMVPGKGLTTIQGNPIPTVPGSERQVGTATRPDAPDYSNVPETWEGAPNKPPPGTGMSQATWDAAVQLATTGRMPQGYGQRNVQQTQEVLSAAPLARRVLGITAADEWKQQSKIAATVAAEAAQDRYFASQQGRQQMDRMNTVASHLDQFRDYAAALNNGDVVAANKLKNRLSVEFGGVEVPDFEMAKTLMADEVVRLLTQTGGTRWDRQDAQERVNAALSGKQLAGVADTLQNFVRAKFESLQTDYVAIPGRIMTDQEKTERGKQFGQMLLPEAQRILSQPAVPVPGLGATPQQQPMVGTQIPLPDWGAKRGTDPDTNKPVIMGKDGKVYNPDHTPYVPQQAQQ